jgi:pimeloyl-ACP methyl ester carboxylesterase
MTDGRPLLEPDPAEPPWAKESLALAGIRVQVRRAGRGAPVVLVHGLGVSSTYFGPLAGLLARRTRVVAPDLPGWGGSQRPAAPLDIPSAAAVLAEIILAEQKTVGSTLVANSFGCQVAIELARSWPGLVRALVLISPTVDPRYRRWARQAETLMVDWMREPPALWPIIARDYRRMGPRGLVATAAFALRDRPETKLPEITAPLLVLRGERDATTTSAWARRCAQLATNGSFAPIPGAAHAAHFSHPRDVAKVVSSFVSERADRGH